MLPVRSDANVVAGDLLVVDEARLIERQFEPPEIPQGMDYVHFNVLFAAVRPPFRGPVAYPVHGHLPDQPLQAHHCARRREFYFSCIKSTDNKHTPAVTPKTVGYIHSLIIDTLTFHSTEAPYASALIVQEEVS